MDPYAPPKARIDDPTVPTRGAIRLLVAAVTALQAVLVVANAKTWGLMINSGEVAPITGLGAIVSCILLYVGAARFARNAARGRYPFLLAAAGLTTTWCGWSKFYIGPLPLLMGAIVAAFGCLAALTLGRKGASGPSPSRAD